MPRHSALGRDATVHIDASIIVAYLNFEERDQYAHGHRVVSRLSKEVKRGSVEVVVSSTALAEVLLWVAENPGIRGTTSRLSELFGMLSPRVVWPSEEVCELAAEIRERDYRIGPADSIITAQALLDPDSTRLLTTDREVIESKAIDEINERLTNEGERRRKLKISEE